MIGIAGPGGRRGRVPPRSRATALSGAIGKPLSRELSSWAQFGHREPSSGPPDRSAARAARPAAPALPRVAGCGDGGRSRPGRRRGPATHDRRTQSVLVPARGLTRLTGLHSNTEVARRVVRSGVNPIGEPGGVPFRRADYVAVGGRNAQRPYTMDTRAAERATYIAGTLGFDEISGPRIGGYMRG
jgi:hypothetical protein